MVGVSTILGRLERWNVALFLVAGGMVLVATANNALGAYTSLVTQEGILLAVEAFAGFGGMVLAFLALVGLYPRLSDRASRLARVGVGLVLLPAVFFATLLACSIPADFLGLPSLRSLIPAFGTVSIAVFLLSAVGVIVLGVAALRILSRTVGSALLVFGVSWLLFFGAGSLSGFPISDHLTVVTGTMQVLALLAIGYGLRGRGDPAARTDPAPGPTA